MTQQFKKDSSIADIRRAAMNLLARREYSRKELMDRLGSRFTNSEVEVIEQIDRLTEEGLQSDERMAENYVRARFNRGQGPLKIQMELRTRGIAEDLIASALSDSALSWDEQAANVLRKRFGDLLANDLKSKGKHARFLQQRGFSFDAINKLL